MSPSKQKRLRMFAGPNGSGKTSLIWKLGREFSADGLFQLGHFVNADEYFRLLHEGKGISLAGLGQTCTIEQFRDFVSHGGRLAKDHPFLSAVQIHHMHLVAPAELCDGYVAAAIADFFRDELLAAGQSFSFETVMSHESKVEFFARAQAAGFRTYLYFVATESSNINVFRVKNRSALGGHDVPEIKITQRYERCLQLLGPALSHAHRAFLFDNSGDEPVWLAQLTPDGALQLEIDRARLPRWFEKWVVPYYPKTDA